MTTPWKLAVLDMAGTTVRDDGLVEGAMRHAVAEVAPGTVIDEVAFAAHRGGAKLALFEALVPGQAPGALDAFNGHLLERVSGGGVAPIAGAEMAISTMRAGGVAVVLTTGFGRPLVDAMIEQLGWEDLIDGSVSSSDVENGRPAPDLVLAAAQLVGVDSMNRIVVCGDTQNDLRCGANAGAGMVVGVQTGAHSFDTESVPSVVEIIDSIADLPALIGC